MAIGEATKDESDVVKEAVGELFEAIPKTRRMEYFGHLNEIYLFIEATKKVLP